MQTGTIVKRGNTWLLRYYETVLESGKPVKRQKAKKLATYGPEFKTEESVRAKANLILAPINAKVARPESPMAVTNFLQHVYLNHINDTKKPSTQKSYADMFKLVKPHFGALELRNVRVSDIDRILKDLADTKPLAHTTLRNVKSFLSGAFRYARRKDLITDNPVRDAVIERKGKARGETAAYSLDEIVAMLNVLEEPVRTAVLVAAFTGLRVGEIKGLKWSDIEGDRLNVARSVWRGKVTDTKTLSSAAPVPLVPIVRDALAEHRKRSLNNCEYIFYGSTCKPLRLENEVRRTIKPTLAKNNLTWRGWHAFRRGVGTNLNALGVDDTTIQSILRHSDIATTQALYVKPIPAQSQKAMRKLERAFKKAAAC